ncbi:MAG: hypothetical protein ABII22_06560 [Candidatus Micrarchaeota archaeon]
MKEEKQENPFRTKRLFIGRKGILRELEEDLSSSAYYEPKAVGLVGMKGIGKSFILEKVEEMAEKRRFMVIHLAMQKKEMLDERLIRETANSAMHMLVEIPSKNNREYFEHIIEGKMQNYEKIEKIYDKIKNNVHGILFLIENCNEIRETAKIDKMLKGVMRNKRPFMFVFSGTCSNKIYLDKKIKIELFTEQETRSYMEVYLSGTNIKMGEECIKTIYRDSEGHPFMIWEICSILYGKLRENEKIITQGHYLLHLPSIMAKLSKEMFDKVYYELSESERELLRLLAEKEKSAKEISEESKKPMNTVTTLLLRMEKKGSIIRVKRGIYRIFNKLYGKYVLEHS